MCSNNKAIYWSILIEDKTGERLLTLNDGSIACFNEFSSAERYRLDLTLDHLDCSDRTWSGDVVQVESLTDHLIVRDVLGNPIHTFYNRYLPFRAMLVDSTMCA